MKRDAILNEIRDLLLFDYYSSSRPESATETGYRSSAREKGRAIGRTVRENVCNKSKKPVKVVFWGF